MTPHKPYVSKYNQSRSSTISSYVKVQTSKLKYRWVFWFWDWYLASILKAPSRNVIPRVLSLSLSEDSWRARLTLKICIKIQFIINRETNGYWQQARTILKDINGKSDPLPDSELTPPYGIDLTKDQSSSIQLWLT